MMVMTSNYGDNEHKHKLAPRCTGSGTSSVELTCCPPGRNGLFDTAGRITRWAFSENYRAFAFSASVTTISSPAGERFPHVCVLRALGDYDGIFEEVKTTSPKKILLDLSSKTASETHGVLCSLRSLGTKVFGMARKSCDPKDRNQWWWVGKCCKWAFVLTFIYWIVSCFLSKLYNGWLLMFLMADPMGLMTFTTRCGKDEMIKDLLQHFLRLLELHSKNPL